MPEFPARGGGGDAITSLTGDVTATGPGAAAATLAGTAVSHLNVATSSLKGLMSAADFSRVLQMWTSDAPKQGAALTGNDQTIQPFSDGCSEYVLSSSLPAGKALTLGNTSAPSDGYLWSCRIVRTGGGAGAYTVKKADGNTIFVFPSNSPPTALICYCANGIWAANLVYFVST